MIKFDFIIRYINSTVLTYLTISTHDLQHYPARYMPSFHSIFFGFGGITLVKKYWTSVAENTASNIFWRKLRYVII